MTGKGWVSRRMAWWVLPSVDEPIGPSGPQPGRTDGSRPVGQGLGPGPLPEVSTGAAFLC